MKFLKIILVLTGMAVIATCVFILIARIKPPKPPDSGVNQFIKRIVNEIDSLGKLPDSKFCREFYKEIEYHINDYYKHDPPTYPFGRLGNNQMENDQWKENLSKNLYNAYSEKFIKQAFYVFRGSEWKNENLTIIRSEYQTLRKSNLLEKGSPVDREFTKIQTVLGKYDEIAGFISASNGFSYSGNTLSEHFPVSDVKDKISRAADYAKNNLENEYVKNCTRLLDGLKEVPQALFRAHVRYLDSKIEQWSGLFSNYNSQRDYANNLFTPLKNEIEALDNNIYKADNFDGEYNRLNDKLNADSQKAFEYFSKQ